MGGRSGRRPSHGRPLAGSPYGRRVTRSMAGGGGVRRQTRSMTKKGDGQLEEGIKDEEEVRRVILKKVCVCSGSLVAMSLLSCLCVVHSAEKAVR